MNDHLLRNEPLSDQLCWRTAEAGFWVGTRGGSFAGTVDQQGAHFYARNQFSEYLGDFTDLSRAQRAVERQPSHTGRRTLQGAA